MIRARHIPALTVALVALAIGAGCGGGDEEAPETSSTSAQQAEQAEARAEATKQSEAAREQFEKRNQAEAPTPEEQEAEQVATEFYAILGEDKATKSKNKTTVDSPSFCELMSAEARAQTVHYAEVASSSGQEWDCESAVELLVIRSKRNGGPGPAQGVEVVGINVEGDQATATVRFGDGPLTALPLVKEDGEWKLAATPVAGGS